MIDFTGRFCLYASPEKGKVNPSMPGVYLKDGESFESLVRRFKKQCEKGGILADVRKRECYEKPSVAKKKKSMQARKKSFQSGRPRD